MTLPLLSIVIPTFNRKEILAKLLLDINTVLEVHHEKVQVIVGDNSSTDGTKEFLEHYQNSLEASSVKVICRSFNIGMEANIACLITECQGKYVWLLSDHQRLCVSEVVNVIEQMNSLEFDIGYAKLVQWQSVLSDKQKPIIWSSISSLDRGALLFVVGNMSALIFRREMAIQSVKTIFECCIWGYPHLGVVNAISNETRFIEFRDMSILPDVVNGKKLAHDYDVVATRYYKNISCVKKLCSFAGIAFPSSGFFTKDYKRAFIGDVCALLLKPDVLKFNTSKVLLSIVFVNPLLLKVVALAVLTIITLFPRGFRVFVAGYAKAKIKKMAESGRSKNAT